MFYKHLKTFQWWKWHQGRLKQGKIVECRSLQVCSLQSLFYPWSAVCHLRFTLIDTIILRHVVLFFTCLSVIQYVRCTFCRLMPAFCFPRLFFSNLHKTWSRHQFCNLGNGHCDPISTYNPCLYSWCISLCTHSRYLYCHCQFF